MFNLYQLEKAASSNDAAENKNLHDKWLNDKKILPKRRANSRK